MPCNEFCHIGYFVSPPFDGAQDGFSGLATTCQRKKYRHFDELNVDIFNSTSVSFSSFNHRPGSGQHASQVIKTHHLHRFFVFHEAGFFDVFFQFGD